MRTRFDKSALAPTGSEMATLEPLTRPCLMPLSPAHSCLKSAVATLRPLHTRFKKAGDGISPSLSSSKPYTPPASTNGGQDWCVTCDRHHGFAQKRMCLAGCSSKWLVQQLLPNSMRERRYAHAVADACVQAMLCVCVKWVYVCCKQLQRLIPTQEAVMHFLDIARLRNLQCCRSPTDLPYILSELCSSPLYTQPQGRRMVPVPSPRTVPRNESRPMCHQGSSISRRGIWRAGHCKRLL